MGADYYFHPMGTLPGDKPVAPKVEDEFFLKLGQRFAALEQELALVKQQLENTEKVYDRALQENIRLQDENIRLQDCGVIDEEIINALDEMVEQPSADAKLNDELQKAYETIVLLMNLRDWGAATGALLGDGVVKKAYRSVDPNDHRPMIQKWQSKKGDEQPVGTAVTSAKAGEPVQLSLGATRTAHDELQIAEVKVALAQGDAAKVKQTLTQTQKACRRYKARIERQKVQLEALQTLADKAFPLYEILLSLDSPRTLTEVTAACIDFHNAFNEAAEALTPPSGGTEI